MKVVYIAGPYRGANAWIVEQNIQRAEALAFAVAELGCAVVCPHTNSRNFDGTLTDEYWLASTMEIMRRCDAVMLVEGWERSTGTQGEIAEALRLKIPVFEHIVGLKYWMNGSTT